MLDNHSDHNFEKAFIQKSWKDLREQLDAELPTQQSTKKPWLLYLCAFQFLALAFVSLLWYNSDIDTIYAETTKERIIVEKVYIKEEIPVNHTVIRNVPNKPLSYNRTQFDNNKEYPSITYIFSALPEITEKAQEKSNQDNINIVNTIPSISPLYSKPELTLEFASEEKHKKPFYISQILKNSLTFGVGITTLATNNLDYTGYGLVGTLQYKFNKKLGLSTGLGFNRISREILFVPMFHNQESSYDVSPKEIFLDNPETYYRSLSDMKQIYVPFIANYNISNKLALLSGFKLRYTFDTNVDNTLTSALVQKTVSSLVDPHNAYYNRANVGLAFGLSFSPNNHFSLDIDTEFGLGSMINKDQFNRDNKPSYNLNLINVTTNYKF